MHWSWVLVDPLGNWLKHNLTNDSIVHCMNVVATIGVQPTHTHTSALAVWLAKHNVRCVVRILLCPESLSRPYIYYTTQSLLTTTLGVGLVLRLGSLWKEAEFVNKFSRSSLALCLGCTGDSQAACTIAAVGVLAPGNLVVRVRVPGGQAQRVAIAVLVNHVLVALVDRPAPIRAVNLLQDKKKDLVYE